jgi:hypothetical protein
MTTEKTIKRVYKELYKKLACHNQIIESKSMWKWCLDCNRKAFTISQPDDQIMESRFADYRIFCLRCEQTEIIKSSRYSQKQAIRSFLLDLIQHFDLFPLEITGIKQELKDNG